MLFQEPARQRLIYAGQLLKDSLRLDDFIRVYDVEQQQVVHFVYTPRADEVRKDVELRRRPVSSVGGVAATSPIGIGVTSSSSSSLSSNGSLGNPTVQTQAPTVLLPSQALDANSAFWLQTQQMYAAYLNNYAN